MFYVVENMNVKIDPKYGFCTVWCYSSQRAVTLWRVGNAHPKNCLCLHSRAAGVDGEAESCRGSMAVPSSRATRCPTSLHVLVHEIWWAYPASLARIAVQLVTRS